MEVLSYQPHSGKYSPFPHGELLSTSKYLASPSSSPTLRQSSISSRNKPSDGVSQLHGTDNVDGSENSDDELPSIQKLLPPATQAPQAYQANLEAFKLPSASQNSPRSPSLNPSVQAAKSPAPPPLGTTPAPRKSFFKNIPAWSFLNSLPAETLTSADQAKTNNEPAVRPSVVPGLYMSRGSSIDSSVGDGCHISRGNSQEIPIVIDDDDDHGDSTDRSNHTSHQMTVNDPRVGGENTEGDADVAAYTGEGVDNSDPDDAAMPRSDDCSAIATSTFFSPEILESDNGATLEEERQLHPSVQGDSIVSLPGKRSRSLSGSNRVDSRGSDWVFDVFAEDDSGGEGDGSPSSKRARSSPRPSEVTENQPRPAAAVKSVQMPGSAYDDRSPPGDQEYEVHQVVGESGSGYEVTALTKIWLPKASVHPKLARKYRAEQRAVTRVRTRWSSRLQNKN